MEKELTWDNSPLWPPGLIGILALVFWVKKSIKKTRGD